MGRHCYLGILVYNNNLLITSICLLKETTSVSLCIITVSYGTWAFLMGAKLTEISEWFWTFWRHLYTNCLTVNMLFYQLIIDDCGVPVLKCIIVACFFLCSQRIHKSIQQWRDTSVLYEGDGGGYYSLRSCASNGAFNKSSKIDVRLHSHFSINQNFFWMSLKWLFFPIMWYTHFL